MQRLLIASLIILVMAGSVAATEAHLVYQKVLPGVSYPQVVLGPDGEPRGILYLAGADNHWPGPPADLVYDRFGAPKPDTIPIAGTSPRSFIARMPNDTLTIYAISTADAYWTEETALITKVTYLDSVIDTDTLYCFDDYGEFINVVYRLGLPTIRWVNVDTTGLGGGGVIFNIKREWTLIENTMGVRKSDSSTTRWYTWDLDSVVLETDGQVSIPGRFGPDQNLNTVNFKPVLDDVQDDPWNSYYHYWTSVWMEGVFRGGAYLGSSALLMVGDFTDQYPGDEFIYRGHARDLAGVRDTLETYQSCYAVIDSGLVEVWYDSLCQYMPYRYSPALGKVIGFRYFTTGTRVAVVEPSTGVADMINLERIFGMPSFFESGRDELTFGMVGRSGDTTMMYQFGTPTAVDEPEPTVPSAFHLSQNYPNPFNATTSIRFTLPERSGVRAVIYNLLGQEVAVLADRDFSAGEHHLEWNGTNAGGHSVASGLYLLLLTAEDRSATVRMVLMK